MSIGNRIKQKRKELELSVDELAELLHKNRATIYRYESDDIENLPIQILEPLAVALKTTPAYLMGWNENDDNNKVAEDNTEYYINHIDDSISEYFVNNKFSKDEIKDIIKYAEFIKTKRDV